MAFFEFWRDVSIGSPFDSITRYRYDTDDDSITPDSFNVPTGNLGPIHPAAGTVMYTMCEEPPLGTAGNPYSWTFKSTGSSANLTKVVAFDGSCCVISSADFSFSRTNNTDPLTPNGTINVVGVGATDINDYEGSIDGGSSWIAAVADALTWTGLPAGNYTVIVRLAGNPCTTSAPITITDQFTYPPLIVVESSEPDLYSPVFYPITLGFTLQNNTVNVKTDINGTYLEALTTDSAEYLANGGTDGGFPIIKIIDNADYEGKYQITSRSTPGDPPDVGTKFYIDATYTTDQLVYFVPFRRQVFFLYAETEFNVYSKISEIAVYPDADSTVGEYLLRLEGFLQGAFKTLPPPVNNGVELSLLRKYYVVPRDFDYSGTPTVFNAVFSAIPTLTPFLDTLIPLGPLPINFINEQTQKGLPVLFSYIDIATSRVVNITSSQATDVTSTAPVVYVAGLPLNQYDVTWINPAGVIADLQVTPELPIWITLVPSEPDRVVLHIDLSVGYEGDYDPDDYDLEDYLTGGVNSIVGCYEFLFEDGTDDLFVLNICAFPVEKSNFYCATPDAFNVAWINQEGGWSSYIFNGKQSFGRDIGSVKTYKVGGVQKRSAVKEVYDTAEVSINAVDTDDLDFIASLRTSVQAYLYSTETQQWSIPIIVEGKSFDKYSRPFNQIEVATELKFRYATEIKVQTQ